jgi:hypothetical protein
MKPARSQVYCGNDSGLDMQPIFLRKLHPHGHYNQACQVQSQQPGHGQRLEATTSIRRESVRAGVSLVVTPQTM